MPPRTGETIPRGLVVAKLISDRDLAANIGVGFKTPEEFFLNAETEPYQHIFEPVEHLASIDSAHAKNDDLAPFMKKSLQELVIFCGSPGAGKSTFYWQVLKPQGYERVNQDILKKVCGYSYNMDVSKLRQSSVSDV